MSDYHSKTQINYGWHNKDARIDIIIYNKDRPFIIIENKVNAPLRMNQLKNYDKILELNRCIKLAIVKHYFEKFIESTKWTIFHWADFYQEYMLILEKGIKNSTDYSTISNFTEYLELMNMAHVNKIIHSDLQNFAETIYKIRNSGKPYISLTNKNIFETGTKILSILEEIIDLAHQEPLLLKSVGKNFRYTPKLNYWTEEEDYSEKNNLWISIFISLSKPINEMEKLGTGFFFYNDRPNKYSIITYCADKKENFIKEVYYKKKDVRFDEYANQVINSWKNWIK